jgi:hypothetical protein
MWYRSGIAEKLLPSQEGLSSMEIGSVIAISGEIL